MKILHLWRVLVLAGTVAAGALVHTEAPAEAQDSVRVYDVTITNLATGQLLSPPVVATHAGDYAVFEVGERASEGLWTVAEQGNPMKLAEELRAAPEVDAVAVAAGPLHRVGGSGESIVTLRIEGRGQEHLSVTMMLGCTNDGFTGLSSVPLSRSMVPVTYYGAAYDAGTERNNQLWSSMPDGRNALGPAPRDPDGQNDRELTDDPIAMHMGIVPGVGNLTEAFVWSDPVVKITIQRVE
jgi:hypothetical protein